MDKDRNELKNQEFSDCVKLASEIIGVKCNTTQMTSDSEVDEGIKYQIVPNPFTIADSEKRIEFIAFEDFFYENFGKSKDSCYYDTPSEAFVGIMKAWHFWNNGSDGLKNTYLEEAREKNK